jgi:hypothetical protein
VAAGSYYGIVFPEITTGRTGRAIQRLGGHTAQLLQVYLTFTRHANMIGLYRLALQDVGYELAMREKHVVAALATIEEAGFAHYDVATEFVWVVNMARVRLGLEPGQALASNDKRIVGVNRLYHAIDTNPFLGPFFDRYARTLHLSKRRDPQEEGASSVAASPFDGASEGLGSQYQYQKQDQDQKQDQEKARRSRVASPSPVENLRVITRLVRELRLEHPDAGFADLKDLAKSRCAQLRIAYDAEAIGKAVDSALSQGLAHAAH